MYGPDTYSVFGTRLCLGCSITYPTAIVVIASFLILRWDPIGGYVFHGDLLLLASLVLGSSQMVKYIYPMEGKTARIVVKIALGLSLGGLVVWAISFPATWLVRGIILVLILMIVSFFGTYRYNYLRKVCSGCIYHGDWDICYGFRAFNLHSLLRNRTDRLSLRRTMFDKRRKTSLESAPVDVGLARALPEPLLEDSPPWLYHESAYKVPWLPLTGLEVSDPARIPRK